VRPVAKRKRKPRTPPPPRRPKTEAAAQLRVQAPQVRKKEKRRRSSVAQDRRARIILYSLGGSGILGLGAVLIAIFALGSGGGTTQVLGDSCVQTEYPVRPGTHVFKLNAKVKWTSFPPTSGMHYASPVPWGFYTQRINPRESLHNLEHGGIDIFYGSKIPKAQVDDQLRSFWQDDPNGLVVAPMPKRDPHITAPASPGLDRKIVMVAWTAKPYKARQRGAITPGHGFYIACSRFDEKTASSFVKIHRGKGPERYPVDSLTPGQ
jgi:hypothetical protein